MPRLPGVNHLDAVRALERAGFWIARQGKHVVMTDGKRIVTIPQHHPLHSIGMPMETDQSTRQTSRHLTVGLVTLGVAVLYVARVFLVPWPPACFLMPLTLMALGCGAVAILIGLTLKANRIRRRLWKHVGVLLAIVVALYLLTVGPCSFFGLLDLQLRAAVARTGGRDQLQAWAMDVLEKSRDHLDEHIDNWPLPPESWSDQVHRLHPRGVSLWVKFEGDRRGVCLNYGGGFLHYSLLVGPPGSRPRPSLSDRSNRSSLVRWADGIFVWFYG